MGGPGTSEVVDTPFSSSSSLKSTRNSTRSISTIDGVFSGGVVSARGGRCKRRRTLQIGLLWSSVTYSFAFLGMCCSACSQLAKPLAYKEASKHKASQYCAASDLAGARTPARMATPRLGEV